MTMRCQQRQQALLLPQAAPVPGKPAVGQASWASLPWAHFDTFCKKKERGGRSWKASSPTGRGERLQEEHKRASSPAEGIKNPVESKELLICLSQHREEKKVRPV